MPEPPVLVAVVVGLAVFAAMLVLAIRRVQGARGATGSRTPAGGSASREAGDLDALFSDAQAALKAERWETALGKIQAIGSRLRDLRGRAEFGSGQRQLDVEDALLVTSSAEGLVSNKLKDRTIFIPVVQLTDSLSRCAAVVARLSGRSKAAPPDAGDDEGAR